jgi:hypothetical protein
MEVAIRNTTQVQELAADFCRCERLARAARRAHVQAMFQRAMAGGILMGLSRSQYIWLEYSNYSNTNDNNLLFLVSYKYI